MRTTWRLRDGPRAPTLEFPNRSRAYDATRRAVRFWGNDGAMEASGGRSRGGRFRGD
jgi:hypothetical protein